MKKYRLLPLVALLLLLSAASPVSAQMYKFSGGPSGGTFQYYASAIATLSKKAGMRVLVSASGGSIENIRLVNSGKATFGIAFSGNIWAAANGKLKNDDQKYPKVLACAFFYGAPAQLVVKRDLNISSPAELAGKRVGVGNAGSGAAANSELFFSELGIWDKISRENLGYRAAATALSNNQLDAFWVFGGYPNASVIEAALQNEVIILNTWQAAMEVQLFEKYPYFSKILIPAGTYRGQSEAVASFQDAAIWIAGKEVPDMVVYKMLETVFSDNGLAHMVEVHKSALGMSIANGIEGIVTEMHPGAVRFWKEKGLIE